MKKQYITPSIKSVNVMINEYMVLTGSLGNDTTDTMGSNGHRDYWSDDWEDED